MHTLILNNWHISDHAAEAFGKALPYLSSNIKSLSISNSGIKDKGIEWILKGLNKNDIGKILNLQIYNKIRV